MPYNKASRQEDATERLQAALGKLEVALGATRDAVAWTDDRGRVEWCNAAFDRLTRLPHMKVIGGDIVEVLPLDRWSQADKPHPAKSVLVKRTFANEIIEIKREEKTFFLDFSGSWAQGGGVDPIAVFVIRDATARVLREEQLKRTTAILEAQQEATLEGILIVDEQGKILNYNGRFLEMWGIPKTVIASRCDQHALEHVLEKLADPEAFLARVRHLYEHPAETSHEEIALKDGRVFERHSTSINGVDGIYYGRAWYFRDVSARNKTAQALEYKSRELERSNAELQQFASAASHDLMEPLRKIAAFGDLLRRQAGATLDATSLGFLDRMQMAAARMGRLIDDLLQYSRVFGDNRPFELVDLGQVARDVLDDLDLAVASAKAQIVVGSLPAIWGHPFQMRQLLQNLIANALKFRRPDGATRVTVSSRPAAPGFVEIAVADNGIGFEPRYADKIFEPFWKLHPRSEYDGTGLGLAICRRIVARHGGWIAASGAPARGSTFVVTLPVGGKP